MKTFNVIENRGNGVKFAIISGTYMDCVNWMDRNTIPNPLNAKIRISSNADDVDSNGNNFTYTIEADSKDDVFSFHEALDMYGAIYEIRTLCDGIEDQAVANAIKANINGIYNIIRKHISDEVDTAVDAML